MSDSKEQYLQQSRKARVSARSAELAREREREAAEKQAALVRARRNKQRPPVEHVEHCGATFRVINRQQAHRLLTGLRNVDRGVIYRVLKDSEDFPDHPDAHGLAVFLLAEGPVAVERLSLRSRIERHPELLILGLICTGTLQASRYIESSASGEEHMPVLVVLGQTRAPVVSLLRDYCPEHHRRTPHYLDGLRCDLLAIAPFGHNLHVFGEADIHCVISGGGNILFERPPAIACHAESGTPGSRLAIPHGKSWIFFTPTHALHQAVPRDLIETNEFGRPQIVPARWLAALHEGAPLLLPPDEIDSAYDGFPDDLAAAFDHIFATPHPTGPRFRPSRYTGSELVEEQIDGRQVQCRLIVRQIPHSNYVLIWARQRTDTGEITLHLEHQTHPRRDRYYRMGTPDDDSADMRTVKFALLAAIRTLCPKFGLPPGGNDE